MNFYLLIYIYSTNFNIANDLFEQNYFPVSENNWRVNRKVLYLGRKKENQNFANSTLRKIHNTL